MISAPSKMSGGECIARDGSTFIPAYSIPRGCPNILAGCAGEVGYIDRRVSYGEVTGYTRVSLRPYQMDAVRAMTETLSCQGYIVMPCGAGKTTVGVAAIAAIGQPTLIIVHTIDLKNQWREAIKNMEGGPEVSVRTIQSMSKWDYEKWDYAKRDYGMVIVDECHHVPAKTFTEVLSRIPAKWRFGLTATPTREDGLGALIGLSFGQKLYSIGHSELVSGGYLMEPEVKYVHTGFTGEFSLYSDMIEAAMKSQDRNAIISSYAEAEIAKGHSVLILTSRIEHAHMLLDMLDAHGFVSEALTSKMPKKKRREILKDFRAGKIKLVIATSLADEGLDVPCLDRIILALPTRAEGRTIQRIGRIMRTMEGKGTPILYDMIDNIPMAWGQMRARQRAYKKVLGAK
jgi:superfamily II DNA or RNA helicase